MENPMSSSAEWGKGTLIAFRFFFVYFVLYITPFPINLLPGVSDIVAPLAELALKFFEFLAKLIVSQDYKVPTPNGSGDTTINYLQVLVFVTLAVLSTATWSAVDRKRTNHEKLLEALMILMRYYLAYTMINYGLIKVFKIQFPFPTTDRLVQSYGESSPMGLLWTFMGYSTAYNIFTGLGEFIGGALILFRRTRLLGALIVIVIMSNVVVLNFAYDVPAKLFSMHILAISIFIVARDMRRLLNFFLFNRFVDPEANHVFYWNVKTKWYYGGAKFLVILPFLVPGISYYVTTNKEYNEYYDADNRRSMMGSYDVESFALNGQVVPPGELDTRRWKKISINAKSIDIQYMDGGTGPWHFNKNANGSKVIIHSLDLWSTGFFASTINEQSLFLEGKLDQDSIKVILRKERENQFLLVSRGFHWISEAPFNR